MLLRLMRILGLFGLTVLLILASSLESLGQTHDHFSFLSETPALLLFFVIGLVGSGHCIGMCGPFVMGYTQSKNNHWSAHFLYGLGRSSTYGMLGLLVSLFGQFLQALIGFRALLLILAGILMVYLALAELKLFKVALPSVQHWPSYQRVVERLFNQTRWYRTYPLGVVLGFIPCGLTAIGLSFALTQSPVIAMVGMFLFGLGTMPAMVGFGLLIQRLKFPRLQRYIAMLMVLFGGLTIWLGTYRLGWVPPPPQLALLHHLHPTQIPFQNQSQPQHSDPHDHSHH